MTVLRWIIGVIGGLFAAGWIFTVVLYVANGNDALKERGTALRRWTITIALFWFNLEIWGRVIWTIVKWK
jgi:hypothetical protein